MTAISPRLRWGLRVPNITAQRRALHLIFSAGMADEIYLLSPIVLEPMQRMKRDILKNHTQRLNLEEVLMALSICAATNSMVELAITKLCELSGCEAHSTTILSPSDESMLRKLKLNFTCEPEFSNNSLYNV